MGRGIKLCVMTLVLIVGLVTTSCGNDKTAAERPQVAEKEVATASEMKPDAPPEKEITPYEIITMANHPRLGDSVASVREFYKNVSGNAVAIVEKNEEAAQSVLFFKKEYADTTVGTRYKQEDLGEVNKVVCYFSKVGKQMTFEEIKPILLSYFPVEIARENFIYDHGARLYETNGHIIYIWKYKPSGANYYKGRPPYGGNLTVAVKETNGAVSDFGMFYGQSEQLPFIKSVNGYSAEPMDVEFEY